MARAHNIDLTDAVSNPSTSGEENACIHRREMRSKSGQMGESENLKYIFLSTSSIWLQIELKCGYRLDAHTNQWASENC